MKLVLKSYHRVLLLALLTACASWGYLMHRTIVQLAVYQLPDQMSSYFYQNKEYLVRHSVRPDERRNTDPTEASKHFIDFEAYGDSAAWKMPTDWAGAAQRYSVDTLLKYGYVPYWILQMKTRLTDAFAQRNSDSILFYAADLAHYISDANVPLHTSVNYDGQLSGQKGLHGLWESTVPELTFSAFNLSGQKKAHYLRHPEKAVWDAVRHAHTLLPDVFEMERELSKTFPDSVKYRVEQRNGREVKYYTRAFALAYAQRLEPTINDQALRSANMVADFWYTAWVDAGKPDLQTLLAQPITAGEKKQLKKESKAYRKNGLLKAGWLLSKQNTTTEPADK